MYNFLAHKVTHCAAQVHAATRLVCKAQQQVKYHAVGLLGATGQTWRTEAMTVQQLHILTFVHHVSQWDSGSRSYHSEATSLPKAQRMKRYTQNHIRNDKPTTYNEGSRGFSNKFLACLEVICRVDREHFVERCCGVGQSRVGRDRPDTHHNLWQQKLAAQQSKFSDTVTILRLCGAPCPEGRIDMGNCKQRGAARETVFQRSSHQLSC